MGKERNSDAFEIYVVIIDEGDGPYPMPALDGRPTREECEERVTYWNKQEGCSAQLGRVVLEAATARLQDQTSHLKPYHLEPSIQQERQLAGQAG